MDVLTSSCDGGGASVKALGGILMAFPTECSPLTSSSFNPTNELFPCLLPRHTSRLLDAPALEATRSFPQQHGGKLPAASAHKAGLAPSPGDFARLWQQLRNLATEPKAGKWKKAAPVAFLGAVCRRRPTPLKSTIRYARRHRSL